MSSLGHIAQANRASNGARESCYYLLQRVLSYFLCLSMPLPLLNRIKAVRGYKASCRMAGRPSVVAPNRVQREFTVVKPNQVWVTDITYSAPGFQGG